MGKQIYWKRLVMLVFLFLGSLATPLLASGNESPKGMKVVGYVPDYDYKLIESTIDFTKFSDLNYFNMLPQADGSLAFSDSGSPDRLMAFVKQGHGHNVKVGLSIGGWGNDKAFESATSPENLQRFVKELVSTAKKYQLDTLDIDWEYPAAEFSQQFETFIVTLSEALDGHTALSICVPTGVAANGRELMDWSQHFTPKALHEADWVNIMSYDAEVAPSDHHSPLFLQNLNLRYWSTLMGGESMGKLVSGIPFYGKADNGSVKTYAQLTGSSDKALTSDKVLVDGTSYRFNSKQTVKSKVQDTIDSGALGVMVWTPTHDNPIATGNRLIDIISQTLVDNQFVLENTLVPESITSKPRAIWWQQKESYLLIGILLVTLLYNKLGSFLIPKEIKGKTVNRRQFSQALATIISIGIMIILLMEVLWKSYLVSFL
ncbi:glycoside hydrolase family 18 protein [uncultured Vagococcus sp.]|uniref:glycoside hydrolase family 18 protein n=1 Tax=uncultured Vagococcus sp. TaxID=189676 RepID=UPI0028D6CF0D|nr:glycoside hydrolase family 18 protein [uncultured Vagococcus sp.]